MKVATWNIGEDETKKNGKLEMNSPVFDAEGENKNTGKIKLFKAVGLNPVALFSIYFKTNFYCNARHNHLFFKKCIA